MGVCLRSSSCSKAAYVASRKGRPIECHAMQQGNQEVPGVDGAAGAKGAVSEACARDRRQGELGICKMVYSVCMLQVQAGPALLGKTHMPCHVNALAWHGMAWHQDKVPH